MPTARGSSPFGDQASSPHLNAGLGQTEGASTSYAFVQCIACIGARACQDRKMLW